MKFGVIDTRDSEGAVLAHALAAPGISLRKGCVITSSLRHNLIEHGLKQIVAARLEPDDVGENEAALRLARHIAGADIDTEPPFTGRCNLFAAARGLLLVARDRIDGANDIDEAVTIATLEPYSLVEAGDVVGTVKIIPFATPRVVVERACADDLGGGLSVARFKALRVAAISTLLPALKASTIEKTLAIFRARLEVAGASLLSHATVEHSVRALRDAIETAAHDVDLIVVFGASAITDRRDIVPSGVVAAGGSVLHLGMPVDPGNLLMLGEMVRPDGRLIPIVGAPGCARSPHLNGFDLVLRRLLAGLPVTGRDIKRMGVGGLLAEYSASGWPSRRDSTGNVGPS